MPNRLRLLALLSHVALLSSPVVAQVQPGGLGTRVNGSALGRCDSGVCAIAGGAAAGGNLFLRLGRYDTRSGIQRVDLDTRRRQTVVVGVGDAAGSFFDTPLRLSSPASLIWLSPGGIWLGPGSRIVNAPSQLFSTSPSIRLGSGVFVASGGLEAAVGQLGQAIQLEPHEDGTGDISQRLGLQGSAPIVLAGGRLTVDRHLLLDSGRGAIVTAPGTSSELRAGGALQLSGGNLNLQRLQLHSEGPLALQALAEEGQVQLRQANLQGESVLVHGRGGLRAEGVSVQSGTSSQGGVLQLETGSTPSATMQLHRVALQGGEVLLRSGGSLQADGLQAKAADGNLIVQSSTGSVHLSESQLRGGQVRIQGDRARLEQVELQGASIEVSTRSGLQIQNLSATAQDIARQGQIVLQAGSGTGDQGSGKVELRDLVLRGDAVQVRAAAELQAAGLEVVADPSGAGGQIVLQSGWGSNSNGRAAIHDSQLKAATIAVRAPGGFELERVTVDTHQAGDRGVIELASESQSADASRLTAVRLRAQQIAISSGSGLVVKNVSGEAGGPGRRGLIHLQGASPGNPGPGALTVGDTRLSGQLINLKAGDISIERSQLHAPKGALQFEAVSSNGTGGIQIRDTTLDTGVHQWEDLVRETSFVNQQFGVNIGKDYPASIGLYADGSIQVSHGSILSTTQDVSSYQVNEPDNFRSQARLSATSGVIVLDAGNAITVSQSHLQANATHTLAGDIVLRSKGHDQAAMTRVEDSVLSASGGLGAGDIWLSSKNGISIRNSKLLSLADQMPAGQRWHEMYAGGGITLKNESTSHGIRLENTELRAQQTTTGGTYEAVQYSSIKIPPSDPFDIQDSFPGRFPTPLSTGGSIAIASNGGIDVSGSRSVLSVASMDPVHGVPESFGGIIRMLNETRSPIHIEGGVTIDIETGPAKESGSLNHSAAGELHIWNLGPITISGTELNAKTNTPRAAGSSNSAATIVISAGEEIQIQNSRFDMRSNNGLPNLVLVSRSSARSEISDSSVQSDKNDIPLKVQSVTSRQLSDNRSGLATSKSHRSWDRLDDRPADISERMRMTTLGNSGTVVVFQPGQPPATLRPESAATTRGQTPRPAQSSSPSDLRQQPTELLRSVPLASAERNQPPGFSGPKLAPQEEGMTGVTASTMGSRALSPSEAMEGFTEAETRSTSNTLAALGMRDRPSSGSLSVPVLQAQLQAATLGGQRPAILRINLSAVDASGTAQLDQILIPPKGDIRGWTSRVAASQLQEQIRQLHRLSSQQLGFVSEPSRLTLGQILLGPALAALEQEGITSLLLSLDRGLQGIPFSALPIKDGYFGEHYALTITPALALTDLGTSRQQTGAVRNLLAGSSRFQNGLAPLPMVPQELQRIAALRPDSRIMLDDEFTVKALRDALQSGSVGHLHIASHAELQTKDGRPARIFTSSGELLLKDLAIPAQPSPSHSPDLVMVSACRTALGDELSELGIAGLALQAGATSAIGTLWLIDDAVATAFAVQFHRLLHLGIAKDKALQMTQEAFRRGAIQVRGDQIIDSNGDSLVGGLSVSEQARLGPGLQHPYYWAGFVLSGRPW